MTEFTRDELSMLLRHATLLASSSRYQLKQHDGKRRAGPRVAILERRIAVAEGAAAKLQERLDALGDLPGLRAA